jgi:transcriptional regulator of arginine metabolism
MKSLREKLIKQIIDDENSKVSSQDELIALLSEHGVKITQATLSRDLADIGAKKVRENGVLRYKLPKINTPPIFTAGIKKVRVAANIVVIGCEPGAAGAVCVSIDDMALRDVVGTIAGDDTIFAACESHEAAKRFADKINNLLGDR